MMRVWSSKDGTRRGGASKALAVAVATLALCACDSDRRSGSVLQPPTPTPTPSPTPTPPVAVTPIGRLLQPVARGPITHVTASGWRIEIDNGAVTVKPPATGTQTEFKYVSRGTRELLGTQEIRSWAGDRRSVLLPGGAKLTMRSQAGALLRVSLYDGEESHEIDALTQTVMHSQVDTSVAASRDAAEHDGETAHLMADLFRRSAQAEPELEWLYLADLYSQGAGADGVPQQKIVAARALGRQFGNRVDIYSIAAPAAPADVRTACESVSQPRGGLTRNADGTLTYLTRSGQWRVVVDKHTITVNYVNPFTLKWEVWGDPHENLNGKHMKDWEISHRSLLLADGTKITMHADGPQQVVHTTSIYDGEQSHEIGNVNNMVRHSCINSAVAAQRDSDDLDGEVAHLAILRSPASAVGSLFVVNIYNELPPAGAGGAAAITFSPVLIGETGEPEVNLNQVRDYYDDPRLAHT